MSIAAGLAAGAAGTAALNTITYLDMLVRGRPASEVPGDAVEQLAHRVGIDLGAGSDQPGEAAQNRKSALGQLLGYATGIGLGGAYGALRRTAPRSIAIAGLALTGAAMVGANGPATVLGITDPRKWGLQGWLADVIPHLGYGFVAAATHRAMVRA